MSVKSPMPSSGPYVPRELRSAPVSVHTGEIEAATSPHPLESQILHAVVLDLAECQRLLDQALQGGRPRQNPAQQE